MQKTETRVLTAVCLLPTASCLPPPASRSLPPASCRFVLNLLVVLVLVQIFFLNNIQLDGIESNYL